MPNPDLDEIERRAEAATSGDRVVADGRCLFDESDRMHKDALFSCGDSYGAEMFADAINDRLALLAHVRALEADRAALAGELKSLAEFAAAHHADQPSHVWLHALTVDIPARIEVLIDTRSQNLCKPTRFDEPPE